MLRGLGGRGPLYWMLGIPGFAVRAWRAASRRSGAGTGRRSGTLGEGARVDPSAVIVESRLGVYSAVERDCVVEHSSLGDYAQLDRHCHVAYSRVGDYTYASLGVTLQRVEIGRFGSIAAYAMIGATSHPMDRVTTHPFTYAPHFGRLRAGEDPAVAEAVAAGQVVVGHDVWIGGHAIVMPGLKVGHGAVVGAHSLVREDVAPYAVVAGVPARPIRQRFDDRTVEQLLRIRWWDWDRETLRRRLDDFANVPLFVEKHGST